MSWSLPPVARTPVGEWKSRVRTGWPSCQLICTVPPFILPPTTFYLFFPRFPFCLQRILPTEERREIRVLEIWGERWFNGGKSKWVWGNKWWGYFRNLIAARACADGCGTGVETCSKDQRWRRDAWFLSSGGKVFHFSFSFFFFVFPFFILRIKDPI